MNDPRGNPVSTTSRSALGASERSRAKPATPLTAHWRQRLGA